MFQDWIVWGFFYFAEIACFILCSTSASCLHSEEILNSLETFELLRIKNK